MNAVQIEVVKLALKKMMSRGHLDITTIDDILKKTGGVPGREDYDTLRMLHCVNFMDYTPKLRDEFPTLLRRVLESPGMNLSIKYEALTKPPELLQ